MLLGNQHAAILPLKTLPYNDKLFLYINYNNVLRHSAENNISSMPILQTTTIMIRPLHTPAMMNVTTLTQATQAHTPLAPGKRVMAPIPTLISPIPTSISSTTDRPGSMTRAPRPSIIHPLCQGGR